VFKISQAARLAPAGFCSHSALGIVCVRQCAFVDGSDTSDWGPAMYGEQNVIGAQLARRTRQTGCQKHVEHVVIWHTGRYVPLHATYEGAYPSLKSARNDRPNGEVRAPRC
jgi:hypothetical protein